MFFQCPNCKSSIDAGNTQFGGQVGCGACGEVVKVPASRLAPGMILGDFAILEPISVGAQASVLLATQTSLQRRVALKVLLPEEDGAQSQVKGFVREARSVAKLNHPGIVQIYAVGDEDGYYYFAMELVLGRSVKEILQDEERPPVEWSLDVCRKIALSLNHARREGNLIHRDIKPSNIIIRDDGTVKLSNLGLAKSVEALQAYAGHVEGTPQYISPEAVLGKRMDFHSDIYSLGATLYHMVTGTPPFRDETAAATAQMHVDSPLVPPHERRPDLSNHVSRVIMKMMEKDPEDRFASLKNLAGALRQTTTRNTRMSTDSNRALRNRGAVMETQIMPIADTDPTVVNQTRRFAAEKKSAKLDRSIILIIVAAIAVVVMMVGVLLAVVYRKKRMRNETLPPPVPSSPALGKVPVVNAGIDQVVLLPGKASLLGSATDDGLPNGTLVIQWSQVSGPARVAFSDVASAKTTATFTAPGEYVLRLTADDTAMSASDQLKITVEAAENKNLAPSVNAGIDHRISVEAGTVKLDARVRDDGRPEGAKVIVGWSKVSGPGNVTFSRGGRVDTGATFSAVGTYVLRLTVNDTEHKVSDDVTVVVQEKEVDGPAVVAINCGGPAYTTKDGVAYMADKYFKKGKVYTKGKVEIGGTEDDVVYQTERNDRGKLTYVIPVANGKYQVILKFAEFQYSRPGQRVFDIMVGGRRIVSQFDIIKQAGKNTAHDIVVPVDVTDGNVNITLNSRVQYPKINAILIKAMP